MSVVIRKTRIAILNGWNITLKLTRNVLCTLNVLICVLFLFPSFCHHFLYSMFFILLLLLVPFYWDSPFSFSQLFPSLYDHQTLPRPLIHNFSYCCPFACIPLFIHTFHRIIFSIAILIFNQQMTMCLIVNVSLVHTCIINSRTNFILYRMVPRMKWTECVASKHRTERFLYTHTRIV